MGDGWIGMLLKLFFFKGGSFCGGGCVLFQWLWTLFTVPQSVITGDIPTIVT